LLKMHGLGAAAPGELPGELKLVRITRAMEQNEQDSRDNDITDSCPR